MTIFVAMDYISLNKKLEQSFKEYWERDAISNYQGMTLRYKDLAREIAMIQLGFDKLGISKGDKIAICSRNQANWAVSFLASLTYGAVPVPILHEFKPENIHYLVNHSESKIFFVEDSIWEGLSESEMPSLKAVVRMSNFKPLYTESNEVYRAIKDTFLEFEKRYSEGFGPENICYYEESPEDLALINYTSGTSGFSKGVMIPCRAVASNVWFALEVEPQLNCESNVVAMLPSAHMYGLMFEFLYAMVLGAHVHFLTRLPSPKIILKAFSEIHPDLIIAVPLIIEKVYKSMIKPQVDRHKAFMRIPILDQYICTRIRNSMIDAFGGRFEEVILGGAAFNPEVEDFLRRIHFPFTVGYGMTECAPIITYSKWYRTRKRSCGQPVKGMEIRIVSDNPHKVPGEIQVRGTNVFLGYYKNEQATKEAFTEDGWFRTGDIGVVDNDGYLYLRGRSKCMILGPSGQNIYPEELEAVINNVTYVIDSLVVEEKGTLLGLVYPDYHQAELDGIGREALEKRLVEGLPQINNLLPSYAQIHHLEFMPEDFERTPKKSIKRYLYQR